MYNLVVFASGNGTTLQAIIDAIDNGIKYIFVEKRRILLF